METDEWISCKDRLPPDKILVLAKNPHIATLSWLDGVDELGKRSWCHENWYHADQFVFEWRYFDDFEVDYILAIEKIAHQKWKEYGCRLLKRDEIDER